MNLLQVSDIGEVALLGHFLLEELAVVDHRIERRAEFMTHIGQKGVFSARRGFESGAGQGFRGIQRGLADSQAGLGVCRGLCSTACRGFSGIEDGVLQRGANAGQKGVEDLLRLTTQDKRCRAMACQDSKELVLEEDGQAEETAPATLPPAVKRDEAGLAIEVWDVEELTVSRHPPDGVLFQTVVGGGASWPAVVLQNAPAWSRPATSSTRHNDAAWARMSVAAPRAVSCKTASNSSAVGRH